MTPAHIARSISAAEATPCNRASAPSLARQTTVRSTHRAGLSRRAVSAMPAALSRATTWSMAACEVSAAQLMPRRLALA
ncbi:hypothetical protein D3C81_2083820 [compost metagenome]